MTKNFPLMHKQLQQGVKKLGADIPNTMAGFGALHENSIAEGSLTVRTKELMALGIAIAVRCEGCIAYHVHDALEAGATRAEIAETIGVAVLMGGGPALIYGAEAYEALDQFLAAA